MQLETEQQTCCFALSKPYPSLYSTFELGYPLGSPWVEFAYGAIKEKVRKKYPWLQKKVEEARTS